MPGPYTFNKRPDGTFEIRDAAGGVIPDDPANQEFWNAVSWGTQQDEFPHDEFGTFKNKYYYSDMRGVIEHFKKWQSLIYVSGTREYEPAREVRGESERRILNKYRMICLPKTMAQKGDDNNGLAKTCSDVWVTEEVLGAINDQVQDDTSDIRKMSSWPITRTFVYMDVSDFSKLVPGHQNLVINSIVWMVEHDPFWQQHAVHALRDIEAKICIGDGYIFVFRNALTATRFAAYLAQLAEHLVARKQMYIEFHFRMGVHTGEVLCFDDPGRGNWNYIGSGINGGQRVLAAIGKETDDVLFISAEVRQSVAAEPQSPERDAVMSHLHNRGRREDKHKRPWRVYEVSHTALYNEVTNAL